MPATSHCSCFWTNPCHLRVLSLPCPCPIKLGCMESLAQPQGKAAHEAPDRTGWRRLLYNSCHYRPETDALTFWASTGATASTHRSIQRGHGGAHAACCMYLGLRVVVSAQRLSCHTYPLHNRHTLCCVAPYCAWYGMVLSCGCLVKLIECFLIYLRA